MRIDMLLNKLCLTKTRSIAKNACDKNLVWINDKLAKASAEIHPGDTVRFQLYGFDHTIRIDNVPGGNVAKKDTGNYYTMLSRIALPTAD
ncbi:MAG: S4 domain-containing protein [Candidatus Cloacimonadaceae bacterium]|nr:S4 domain-containing protein [Candidatus Cloacimonadaceae bacterium]